LLLLTAGAREWGGQSVVEAREEAALRERTEDTIT
jgi:hypothetical protein